MLKSLDETNAPKGTEVSRHQAEAAPRARVRPLVLVAKALLQALLALAIVFGAYQGMKQLILARDEVPTRPARETVYPVTTRVLEVRDHTPELTVYGEVLAARPAELRALVAGEILRVNPKLETGGTLDAGEELVAIDPFQYEGAVREARPTWPRHARPS